MVASPVAEAGGGCVRRIALMGFLASMLGCAPARIETLTEKELVGRLQASAGDLAPAVVFGCVWRDGTTLVRAAGHADAREGRAVLETTSFAWFSITKLFTATAIVQLAEQHRLDLDAPVSRYLPERRLSKHGREATVRQLLSHSAGLANPIPITWVHLAGEAGPGLDALVEQRIGTAPDLEFEPGQKSSYSNLGYLLLGQIIERVSGQRYEEYVTGHLLLPLGAETTGFSWSEAAATGYQRRWSLTGLAASWLLDARFFGGSSDGYRALRPFTVDGAPYGGLRGPAGDLLRFARMVLAGGQAERGRVLSEASVRAMLTPANDRGGGALDVGLGWHLGREDGQAFAYHVGGGGGFRSEIRVYPDLGYAAVALASETSFPTERLTRLVIR
jgi:CubicO group peptidase (beta-lactamase class C family)